MPDPMKKFIETEVKRGGYRAPSEYVRALVRAEQKRKAEDHLERLLTEGLESGPPISRKVVMDGSGRRTKPASRSSKRGG